MREILFRGKRVDNGEWFYGVPTIDSRGQTVIVENVFDCDEYNCRGASCLYVDENTIGQYTGLTDKNGKKIFEGDILLHDGTVWQSEKKKSREKQIRVVWFNRCGWEGKLIGGCSWSLNTLWDGDTFEVIGNIHDNPELLERG